MMDGICYQRWNKAHRAPGRARVLTSEQARAARARHGSGETIYHIARDLGVPFRTIMQIVEWRTYRDTL